MQPFPFHAAPRAYASNPNQTPLSNSNQTYSCSYCHTFSMELHRTSALLIIPQAAAAASSASPAAPDSSTALPALNANHSHDITPAPQSPANPPAPLPRNSATASNDGAAAASAAAEATGSPPTTSKTAEAKVSNASSEPNASSALEALPPAFLDSLRGAAGLAADVAAIKAVVGDAAALAAHAVFTQPQLDDIAAIRHSAVLQLFYETMCQSLQSMIHIAAAFKTGSVQLDKNSSFSGRLGQLSQHYDGAVEAAGKAAAKVTDFASHAGAFEDAAHAVAKLLDGAAAIAEGIPIASVVIKCISFTVNQWTEKKFDVRMKRLIERLFPDLSPTKWTFVAEEVSRRVTVVFADDVEALHSGTEEQRGRVKNWFRNKCAEYGLAHLTTKADDAVVMMALQRVEGVIQLALGGDVPPRLDYTELAHFLVDKLAPRAAASVVSAAAATPASPSAGRSSSPPPVALHDAASHSEVEELRRELEEQKERDKMREERDKKREEELAALRKQVKKMAQKDQDHDSSGSGGGLVLASSKSEVNAETVKTAAAHAVRPLQQQQIRTQQQVAELSAFIASHGDPVLKDRLEDLNTAAVPVMKKHDGVTGWQERYIAVQLTLTPYFGFV